MTLPVLADCSVCPRLVRYRLENRARFPGWHNAPVGAVGDPRARLLVVGLAPGLKGANRTGVPFRGDDSGAWLWEALREHGFAAAEDGSVAPALRGAAVTNAVKCVPPANRPTAAEAARCRPHLAAELASFADVRVVVALGRVAHDAVVRAGGARPADHPFAHGRVHRRAGSPLLVDCFHPSPLNTRTGRMTRAQWRRVWAKAARLVREPEASEARGSAKGGGTKQWFVYVLRCGDGSLYTGVTTDPERRRAEHAAGTGAKYTRSRGAVALVHVEEAPTKSDAYRREAAIKALDRRRKLALIARGS